MPKRKKELRKANSSGKRVLSGDDLNEKSVDIVDPASGDDEIIALFDVDDEQQIVSVRLTTESIERDR